MRVGDGGKREGEKARGKVKKGKVWAEVREKCREREEEKQMVR